VALEVGDAVGVSVGDTLGVGVGVAVAVRVLVGVGVEVAVAVAVVVAVAVAVAVGVSVAVGVRVGVSVVVLTGVEVTVAVAVLVGVAVGVGLLPTAIPVSFTFCGLFSALSLMVSAPDSFVPVGFAGSTGTKITETLQFAGFAASVAMQAFPLTAKGPLTATELMVIADLLSFESVTAFGADVEPTSTLPNDSSFGLALALRPAADATSGAVR